MQLGYTEPGPTPADIEASAGSLALEFGSNSCGICAAQHPLIAEALAGRPDIPHIQVQDGRGRLLGRNFGVKLWPTLIVLKDGREVGRVVRPATVGEVRAVLALLPN